METIKQTMKTALMSILLIWCSFIVVAQTNAVSIAQTGGSVTMTFRTPAVAGNPVLQVTNSNNWLNYNTTVIPSSTQSSISVQLETTLPPGLQLQILAGTYQGTWGGSGAAPNRRGTGYTSSAVGDSPGIPATVVTVSYLPQVLVSNIGVFDTGVGAYVGHQLTYTLSISDYSKVSSANTSVTVLYTITHQQ